MLQALVASLGGRLDIAPAPAEDLADCDILLLLQPSELFSQEQQNRIWDFVRQGGALLLVAAPVDQPEVVVSGFNDLLSATAMQIRQDVAISATGHWLHACQTFAHPATAAMNPRDGFLFSDTAAAVQTRWPARPLVVGRWGWVDPGSDAALTGVYRYESGETLGDVVLAAEQPMGKGTVVVLGDSSAWTNEGIVRGYEWVGRLMHYLANREGANWHGSPMATYRQAISLILSISLLAILYQCSDSQCLIGVALVLAVFLAPCGFANRSMTRIVPDGRLVDSEQADFLAGPKISSSSRHSKLAYIDAAHVEAYSDRDWSFDAMNGLALNLMREGFLTLTLPRIDRDRLRRAAVIVLLTPARRFSRDERRLLHDFVSAGGVLICTTGAEEALSSQTLLTDLGLRVPPSPVPTGGRQREPEPMGNFRSLFLDANDYNAGDHKVGVSFHAGWPVEAIGKESEVFVYGQNDLPIVICSHVDQGQAVLIGDAGFGLNKNLEYIGGEPFEGRYENAHFWRWLFSRVIHKDDWIPPPAEPPTENPGAEGGEQ
jgi:uncharacterized protein DUF4350